MANVHGRVTFVSLDGDDLSTYSNNVEFTRKADVHDVTTFGNTAHCRAGGLLDGSATVGGIDDAHGALGPRGAGALRPVDQTVELIYRPEGTGTTRPERTVSVVVGEYVKTSPVA